jgi:hypothetical protein
VFISQSLLLSTSPRSLRLLSLLTHRKVPVTPLLRSSLTLSSSHPAPADPSATKRPPLPATPNPPSLPLLPTLLAPPARERHQVRFGEAIRYPPAQARQRLEGREGGRGRVCLSRCRAVSPLGLVRGLSPVLHSMSAAPPSCPLHRCPLHRCPLHRCPLHRCPLHRCPLHRCPLHCSPLHCCPLSVRFRSDTAEGDWKVRDCEVANCDRWRMRHAELRGRIVNMNLACVEPLRCNSACTSCLHKAVGSGRVVSRRLA